MINLRGPNPTAAWYQQEKAACGMTNCTHQDITLSSKHLPSRENLLLILDSLCDLPKPVLMKCSGGSDRTGLACALYLLDKNGPDTLTQAMGQLAAFPFLHLPKKNQRWIREFLDYFGKTYAGRPIRQWIEDFYTPESFATHMTSQGKTDYWRR